MASPPSKLASDAEKPISCPRCQDRGFALLTDGSGRFEVGPCPEPGCFAGRVALREQAERRLRAMFERAEVPFVFRAARLDDFAAQPDRLSRMRLALAEGKSMILWGDVGTGKTHAAYACLNDELLRERPGLAIEVPDLMARLKLAFGSAAEYEGIIQALRSAPLLVIDDLGVELDGKWQEEVLYRVVNGRWLNGLPTIATTNLRPDQLAKRLGLRIVSRLNQVEIEFRGEDRRGWPTANRSRA